VNSTLDSTQPNFRDVLTMDQNTNSNGKPLNSFITLPTELIVHIFSFLTNIRDVVKLRYVSRRFRSACEIPSLWREFIWPRLDIREESCVKSVLKLYGQNVKRLSFPDHVPTPCKLTRLLQNCSNLVELCIPTRKFSPKQLEKIIQSMDKLQNLDVLWSSDISLLLMICDKLKKLTIRVEKQYSINSWLWLDEWVSKGLLPQVLNIVVGQSSQLIYLARNWLNMNPHVPTGHAGCLKVFSSLKVPMDLFPALPDFQLQFGQSCTLPFVKPSKCGLLGLEEEDILLTDSMYGGEVLHKAVMTRLSTDYCSHYSDVTNLSFVTHFDASLCKALYSGHLEQLAMACPNLQHLDLQDNCHCLEKLQGLHTIATCKNLQGLNLMGILEVENHVQLWKILVDLKLIYLGIQLNVLIPWNQDKQADPDIIASFQNCLNLKALAVKCSNCYSRRDLSVLSSFPSLFHFWVDEGDIKVIVSSCAKLKYLSVRYVTQQLGTDLLLQHNNLEQLYINISSSVNSDMFLQSISAHGGLVHVVLSAYRLYDDGITALIENSPNMITCHLYGRVRSSDDNFRMNIRDFTMTVKRKFRNRKLFTSGNFQLSTVSYHAINNILVRGNMDVIPFWSQSRYHYF